MDDYDAEGLDVFQSQSINAGLEPCGVCGRNFMPESLQRHYPICEKNAAKKRKVFDSTKQRVQGTDVSLQKVKQVQKQKEPNPGSDKKNNWKAKHEEFVNTIRAARGVTRALKSGGPLPPPPPPTINPDYVQCQFCSRRFNSTAAERHIPFCKEQQQRLGSKKVVVDQNAKSKQAIRTQYKAPRPRQKGESPGTSVSATRGMMGSQNKTNNASSRSAGSSRYSQSPVQSSQRTTQSSASAVQKSGYDPYSNAESQMKSLRKTAGAANSRTAAIKKYQSQMYSDDEDDDDVDSYHGYGAPMRTGKTQENYDDGKRMNSGPQRRNQPTKSKFSTTTSRRGGYSSPAGNIYTNDSREGYTPSPPATGRPPSGSKSSNVIRHRPFHQVKQESESGYHSNSDGEAPKRKGSAAKFCHDCGTRYPVEWAKFCCECGIKRMILS